MATICLPPGKEVGKFFIPNIVSPILCHKIFSDWSVSDFLGYGAAVLRYCLYYGYAVPRDGSIDLLLLSGYAFISGVFWLLLLIILTIYCSCKIHRGKRALRREQEDFPRTEGAHIPETPIIKGNSSFSSDPGYESFRDRSSVSPSPSGFPPVSPKKSVQGPEVKKEETGLNTHTQKKQVIPDISNQKETEVTTKDTEPEKTVHDNNSKKEEIVKDSDLAVPQDDQSNSGSKESVSNMSGPGQSSNPEKEDSDQEMLDPSNPFHSNTVLYNKNQNVVTFS